MTTADYNSRQYPLPSGTDKWHLRFLQLAALVASWSKDPKRKVGAVVTDHRNRIVSVGFNGFPAYVADTPELYADAPEKLRRTLHAEDNAILFAQRDLATCTIYITYPPCAQCAARIIQSGIMKVVVPAGDWDLSSKWAEDWESARRMFGEAQVIFRAV